MASEKKERGCIHTVWISWIRLCRSINNLIERMFEKHTRFITSHHTAVIIASFGFLLLTAIGAVWFNGLFRNEELFIPQGSEAFTDLDRAQKLFPDMKYRVQDVILTRTDNRNILNDTELFRKALELHQKIEKIASYRDICVKYDDIASGTKKCLVASTLQVFGFNRSQINSIPQKLDTWLQNPKILFTNGRPAWLNYPNLLGNFRTKNNNAQVEFANAMRVTYYTQYATTADDIYSTITKWENKYISLCSDTKDDYDKLGLTLNYFAARTTGDAILESTVGDLPLFSVAFILMVAFCLLVFSRWKNVVTGHVTVAIMGICVIMIGVACGFGVAMWIRTDFVAFTGILMFLILGIGMDNMFIIVDALESVDPDIQGEERLVIAMKHIGGSITMTTSTDLVAFAVSTVSDFPAVTLFCIYAALSIFFAYLMLITLFLALLTWDIHRIERGQRDLLPCRKPIKKAKNENPWLKTKEDISRRVLRRWGEILMTVPMKICVLIFACGLLAAGIYGTTEITQKFEWKKTAPDGSSFRKYADARDGSFPAGYGVSVVLPFSADAYPLNATQQKIIALDKIALNNAKYESMTINWMRDYQQWATQKNLSVLNTGFYSNLPGFLADSPIHIPDVNIDNQTGKISSARVIFFYQNSIDAINQADAMKTLREDLKLHSDIEGVYPISIMFIYAEQFAAVLGDTLRNLAICGATIVVITIPYLMHPGITGLVFLSFSSLLFELLGLMTAWNVSLDVIAMIIIIMAVGFSVDYTCHIAHAYMISQKETPEKRVIDALTTMGTSVLNGGVSTFLGMLITGFSNAEGFRIFFKMVFGIVALGLLHGLVFLPVLLSVFVRRDLREDMQEFIAKHDEEERDKSRERFKSMPEGEKRRQSLHYRRQSVKNTLGNGNDHSNGVIQEVVYHTPDNEQKPGKNADGRVNGLDNAAYGQDEIPVHYSVKAD